MDTVLPCWPGDGIYRYHQWGSKKQLSLPLPMLYLLPTCQLDKFQDHLFALWSKAMSEFADEFENHQDIILRLCICLHCKVGVWFPCSQTHTRACARVYKKQRSHSSTSSSGSGGKAEPCWVQSCLKPVAMHLAWLSGVSAVATHATMATLLVMLALACWEPAPVCVHKGKSHS